MAKGDYPTGELVELVRWNGSEKAKGELANLVKRTVKLEAENITLRAQVAEAEAVIRPLVDYRNRVSATEFQLGKADDYLYGAAAWLARQEGE